MWKRVSFQKTWRGGWVCLRMNAKAEMQEMVFVGQYCEEDIAKVIGFIENLKNEQSRASNTGVKRTS